MTIFIGSNPKKREETEMQRDTTRRYLDKYEKLAEKERDTSIKNRLLERENEAHPELRGLYDEKLRQAALQQSLKSKSEMDLLRSFLPPDAMQDYERHLAKNNPNQPEDLSQAVRQSLMGNNQASLGQTPNSQESLLGNGRRQQQAQQQYQGAPEEGPTLYDRMSPEQRTGLAVTKPQAFNALAKQEELKEQKKTNQRKEVRESFKDNSDYINGVQDKYQGAQNKMALIDKAIALNDEDKLSDSGTINFLETLGLQPEWLKNPSNEEYQKLMLDTLGGGSLQADYGNRLFASEFAVAQKRIPTLSQTKEGRRQIAENMKAALTPAILEEQRLNYYLDKAERTGEPLPHNLRGKIIKDVKPQVDKVYDEFKQRNGRYKVREGTQVDDNAIDKYYEISNGDYPKAKKMMKEDGYDVQ